jgi:hypothetical protein
VTTHLPQEQLRLEALDGEPVTEATWRDLADNRPGAC